MRIALLGATGRTGRRVVEEARRRGHELTVLSRRAATFPEEEGLRLVVGDATDRTAVEQLVDGVDVVVDVLGPRKDSPAELRQQVAAALLPAMASAGVERLVALTGAGVRVDGDEPGLVDRVIVGIMKLVARDQLEDGTAYAERLRSSELDWTLVRGPRLTDGEGGDSVQAAPNVTSASGTSIARADLATFLVDELEDPTWTRQSPIVWT